MRSIKSSSKKLLLTSLLIPVLFVGVMWIVFGIEHIFNIELYRYGLMPRTWSGLRGILFSPFLHGNLNHIVSNSLPMLILMFALISGYPKVAFRTFLMIYFLSGIWVWIAARPDYHIGASGIIYGLVSFLFFMGLFRKDKKSIALALLVTFLYGSLIWGIFPVDPTISWEGHLLGGIAGIFAAVMYYKVDLPKRPKLDDSETGLPYWKYEVEGDIKEEFKHPPPEQNQLNVNYSFKPNRNEDKADKATPQ
jgi:membrane associated rhomboid family serine protease